MQKYRVAILEHDESHTELIPSMIYYLKEYNVAVDLILDKRAYLKVDPEIMGQLDGTHVFNHAKGLIHIFKVAKRINQYIKENEINILILNTASGKYLRNILFFITREVRIIGIIHYPDKVGRSFTQSFISHRVSQYFKLASHLKSDRWIPTFYPLYVPTQTLSPPNEGPIKVVIPGNIELKRRDYQFLLDFSIKYKNKLKDKIKFIIAGNIEKGEGPHFKSKIEAHDLGLLFELYTGFIPQKKYDDLIWSSHYILPLLHPSTTDFEKYLDKKISGSFNLSYAFKKPLLLHKRFRGIKDFDGGSYYYKQDELSELLLDLVCQPTKLIECIKNKFDFKREAKKFYSIVIGKEMESLEE